MPGQPELAVGAIAIGGITVRESPDESGFAGSSREFETLARLEQPELTRRERIYRQGLPPLDLRNKTVVIVDDGIATGCTMVAAVRAARRAGASATVVAVPVASDNGAALVAAEATDLIVLKIPAYLASVGEHYRNFEQVGDAEVLELLKRARKEDWASPPKLQAVQ
jgi:predicted phosphoribosyltransferase